MKCGRQTRQTPAKDCYRSRRHIGLIQAAWWTVLKTEGVSHHVSNTSPAKSGLFLLLPLRVAAAACHKKSLQKISPQSHLRRSQALVAAASPRLKSPPGLSASRYPQRNVILSKSTMQTRQTSRMLVTMLSSGYAFFSYPGRPFFTCRTVSVASKSIQTDTPPYRRATHPWLGRRSSRCSHRSLRLESRIRASQTRSLGRFHNARVSSHCPRL